VAPVTTFAVLLRSHDYGDTSRILRFYTQGRGLVSVMARGIRDRTGKGTTALANFASGELTVYVKSHRDLQTMKDFHCTRLREGIGADMVRFAGASAVAELVLAHADQEESQDLFTALEQGLDALEIVDAQHAPGAALAAVWRVTHAFGFSPQLESCVRCDNQLGDDEVGRFDFAAGGIRCSDCGLDGAGPRIGPIARAQIARLLQGSFEHDVTHPRRHLAILSDFVSYHVVSKPLKSLRFLGALLPSEQEVAP
jgi:DNA repair protein RecO (recombination protein O)